MERMVPESDAGQEDVETVGGGIFTRIYRGGVGRVVITVQAHDTHAASVLNRVCGAAIEAAVYRAFGDRMQQD